MNEDSASSPFAGNEPNLSPQSVVDCASLTNCMGKNKESLKVKLMLRRPIDVLVDQGILPPPKTTPSFYEQKLKLERAKTSDFLKHKIQRRPQVNELIQQHILEESFDPSYYEQQRKLKKARLADDLNERLSHRPGPLELIKGNILHTDECLEQAIKDGQILFKKTSEGEVIKNPPKRFVFEEESSSDSAPSPHQSVASSSCAIVNQPNVANYQLKNSFIVTNGSNLITIPQPEPPKVPPTSNVLNTNLSYFVTSPVANILPSTAPATVFTIANDSEKSSCLNVSTTLASSSIGVVTTSLGPKSDLNNAGPISQISIPSGPAQINQTQKSKKKVKSKNQPKTRIIKFHEYTGPPNVKKQSNSSQSQSETSYELLLKQQQLFLQWQLESGQKYPHMVNQGSINESVSPKELSLLSGEAGAIPNESDSLTIKREESMSPPSSAASLTMNGNFPQLNSAASAKSEESLSFDNNQTAMSDSTCLNAANQSAKQYAPIVKKIISKLEDMKVSDLKAELKKRNLPVSGAKQQLIERLKPFSESVVSTNNSIVTAELNGTPTLFNLGECKGGSPLTNPQDLLNNINTNFSSMGTPLTNSTTTFILKNNMPTEVKKGLNDEVLFITNNRDNFSTIPLQLKQPSPITLETPTLTIPITNTFIPQYQIVSSSPSDNKINIRSINLATPNTIQTPIGNNILLNNKLNILNSQPSIISTNLNYNQAANQIDKNSNLTFFTGEPLQLAPIKNGLSFNITQPVPNIANKLVSIQNSGPVFHQLLLYPTTLNSQDVNSPQNIAKQRSNSLPSESLHQLQRNTSLPVVINQVPLSQATTDLSNQNHPASDRKIDLNISSVQKSPLINSDQSAMMHIQKSNQVKLNSANDNLPNSSTESCVSSADLKTLSEKKSISNFSNCAATKSNQNISPLTSANIVCVESSSTQPKVCASFVDNNGLNHIQPDSTTNSTSLDLDYILNFDDLTDGLGEMSANRIAKATDKLAMDEPMDFEVKGRSLCEDKNNGMIDFNDNWFEMAFDPSVCDMQTSDMLDDTSKLLENGSINSANGSFLDTINQIFDQGFPGCSTKSDDFHVDSLASGTNFMTPNTSNNYQNQQCHFSANLGGSNLKYNLTGSNNAFSTDSFGEFMFEDSDFKNSADFPIILDS